VIYSDKDFHLADCMPSRAYHSTAQETAKEHYKTKLKKVDKKPTNLSKIIK